MRTVARPIPTAVRTADITTATAGITIPIAILIITIITADPTR